MGWSASGSFTTAAATQPLYWTTVFNDATFVGPIAVVANIYADNNIYGNNFGTMTVSDLKVSATQGNPAEPGALWPVSFEYFFTITNDTSNPLVFNVAVGTF